MIQLICTHCRATLEMDDGFAGGACRCKHCGTIQTVPSRLKKTGARAARTLYQARPDAGVPSSGLDQLANVVASSGLGSARLRKASPNDPTPVAKQPPAKNVKMLLIGSLAVIGVLAITLIIVLTRGGNTATPVNATANVPPIASEAPVPAPTPAPVSPNFAGIALTGDTIVYVLDRGDSTRDSFEALKAMTIHSLASLGEKKQFQVIFWNNGKDAAYPKNWPTFATADNRAEAERAIDAITPHGKTDITSALRNAMSGNPTDVVIATGKAWDLDDAFVKNVEQIRGPRSVKIDTVALGDVKDSTALQTIAKETRGTFKAMSDEELKQVTR